MEKAEVILEMRDDIDALAEIVDALANTLAKHHPGNDAMRSIADRARQLYQKLMMDDGGDG